MKLLLASAGVNNPSIRTALVSLLGKPIAEASALFIPTAAYGHPYAGPGAVWQSIAGQHSSLLCDLGWKSLGVLELTALPSLAKELWVPLVQATDCLLVGGGDATYLYYWLRQSGLADLLPGLAQTVWVGQSAGSMVLTPRIGPYFVEWTAPDGSADKTLGVVDFTIFPHLDHPDMPGNTLADAERWAAEMPGPAYAIDDQTAIQVVDSQVEVISEGHWQLLKP